MTCGGTITFASKELDIINKYSVRALVFVEISNSGNKFLYRVVR